MEELLRCSDLFFLEGSNPSRQYSKVLYTWGDQEKKGKHGEVRVKIKWWILALFPARKREAVTQGGTNSRKTKGAGIIKDWEDKRYSGLILEAFT